MTSKNKKKSTKWKKRAAKKAMQANMRTKAKQSAKKVASKKAVARKRDLKDTTSGRTPRTANNRTRIKSREHGSSSSFRETARSRLGEQSGDLQGLSNIESVDSESVDELLEEGNAFEAGIVSGVENPGEHGVTEVRTREVPEDEVPGEYLDKE